MKRWQSKLLTFLTVFQATKGSVPQENVTGKIKYNPVLSFLPNFSYIGIKKSYKHTNLCTPEDCWSTYHWNLPLTQEGNLRQARTSLKKTPKKQYLLVPVEEKTSSLFAQERINPAGRKLWQMDKEVCFKNLLLFTPYAVCLLGGETRQRKKGYLRALWLYHECFCIQSNGEWTTMQFYDAFNPKIYKTKQKISQRSALSLLELWKMNMENKEQSIHINVLVWCPPIFHD